VLLWQRSVLFIRPNTAVSQQLLAFCVDNSSFLNPFFICILVLYLCISSWFLPRNSAGVAVGDSVVLLLLDSWNSWEVLFLVLPSCKTLVGTECLLRASLAWEKQNCVTGAVWPKHLNTTRQGLGFLWSEEAGWGAAMELASYNTQVGLGLALVLTPSPCSSQGITQILPNFHGSPNTCVLISLGLQYFKMGIIQHEKCPGRSYQCLFNTCSSSR